MDGGRAVFLFGASVLAGAVNSVAGGGTLLSFPAAIAAGLPAIVANATNAVALVPGSLAAAWTFRKHLTGLGRLTCLLAVPGVVGALIGAAILRYTPQRLFDGVVPWLVLAATLIILLQGVFTGRGGRTAAVRATDSGDSPLGSRSEMGSDAADESKVRAGRRRRIVAIVVLQLLVSVYGGYFGAAMGIVMLAFLGYLPSLGPRGKLDVHQMNAVKNVLAVVINAAASIDFITHDLVRPAPALLMAAGAISGGVAGGRLARRAQVHHVRRLVVAIGFGMAALLAWRRYG